MSKVDNPATVKSLLAGSAVIHGSALPQRFSRPQSNAAIRPLHSGGRQAVSDTSASFGESAREIHGYGGGG
ncbi:MAG: hypothetical protein AAGI11_22060 [Pseudomonadota bacterium]